MQRHITTVFDVLGADPEADLSDPVALAPLAFRCSAMLHHQVSVNGLDGGTYSVDVLVAGDESYQVHQSGASESDTVISDRLVLDGMRVRFAGVGEDAAPVVTLTSWA